MEGPNERPWRRAIPETPYEPPAVSIATMEDVHAAVRAVMEDLHLEVLRKGEFVPSDIDLATYGHLPEEVLRELQLVADLGARVLAVDASVDPFKTHGERTDFKKANKNKYGSVFKDAFEANRFRLGTTTGFVSRMSSIQSLTSPSGKGVYVSLPAGIKLPHAEELRAVATAMFEGLGPLTSLSERYDKMTVDEKLAIVDVISTAAHDYLAIVTEKEVAVQKAA